MQTITAAVGHGPIREIPTLDAEGHPIPGWSEREPINPPVRRTLITANFGFATNCHPRASSLPPCPALRLGDPLPEPANDNVAPHRWPVYEERKAGRIDDESWARVVRFARCWNDFQTSSASYFAPGTFRHSAEGGRVRSLGLIPGRLYGPEVLSHLLSVCRALDKQTMGAFSIVRRVVVDGSEMHQLALDVRNRAKRAAIGRARLIEALKVTSEALFLLEIEDGI